MKLNKSRVLVIILAVVMLLTGIGAIFVGWRLSQDDSLLPEPGDAAEWLCQVGSTRCSGDTREICVSDDCNGDFSCWKPHGQQEWCDESDYIHECQNGSSTSTGVCCGPSCQGGDPPPGGGGDVGAACPGGTPDCNSNLVCSNGSCQTCEYAANGDEATCWTHNRCQWLNGQCVLASVTGNNDCVVTSTGAGGSSCTVNAVRRDNGQPCTIQVSVAQCRDSYDSQADFNAGTNNGSECRVGCGSTTQSVTGSQTFSVGVPECGRWQLDVTYAGQSLCNGFACNDDGCDVPSNDKAECLETCTTDVECGTGLKCATVGSGKVCIDSDLSNGDQCFDLACETLTSSKTTASVGDTTTLNVAWDVPTSYTTDWSKLLYQSATGYSTIKQCNGLTDCQENWTVPAFTNTPNNAFNFSSQLSFKAFGYNTSLVCQQDGKIIAQVSGNPQVGECDNDCRATLSPLGTTTVLPECTSLTFAKTDPSDTEYPIPGTFQGTGRNGDSSNLITEYEIVAGTTTLGGTVSAAALANLSVSKSYTVNSATTATLTFLTASGTEYTSSACRINLDGTTPVEPEGEIPETGVVEDSIIIITLAVVLSYLTFFLYKNKIGSAMIIASLSSFVARKDKMENNIHTSVNTRKQKIGEKLIKPRDRKKKFERDTVDRFEK